MTRRRRRRLCYAIWPKWEVGVREPVFGSTNLQTYWGCGGILFSTTSEGVIGSWECSRNVCLNTPGRFLIQGIYSTWAGSSINKKRLFLFLFPRLQKICQRLPLLSRDQCPLVAPCCVVCQYQFTVPGIQLTCQLLVFQRIRIAYIWE